MVEMGAVVSSQIIWNVEKKRQIRALHYSQQRAYPYPASVWKYCSEKNTHVFNLQLLQYIVLEYNFLKKMYLLIDFGNCEDS